jgi:hypothetical protein
VLVVQRLAGVLFEVEPLDPDLDGLALGKGRPRLLLTNDRRFVLADLIALRQVRIEIVLPVEDRLEVDLGLETEPRADRLAHAFGIDHREHAGHGGVDQ